MKLDIDKRKLIIQPAEARFTTPDGTKLIAIKFGEYLRLAIDAPNQSLPAFFDLDKDLIRELIEFWAEGKR